MTSPWNADALHGEEFLFFKRKGRIKIFLRSREEVRLRKAFPWAVGAPVLLRKAFPCAGGA